MLRRFYLLLSYTTKGAKILVLPIYPSILSNLLMLQFPLLLVPLLCKKSAVNEVDSQNKSRNSDLALEKWWVTQCCCLLLFMTFDMVMTITNCWKLFCYGVKRYHYEKLIGIRELLEQLAQDCFNNTFSPDRDRGTLAKNNLPLMISMMDIQFLLAVHFIFPVLFLPS